LYVSRFWSNFGLGIEIASGGLAYVGGCAKHRLYLRDTGLTIVDALAAAGMADLVLKLAFGVLIGKTLQRPVLMEAALHKMSPGTKHPPNAMIHGHMH
jgi:hypothetical protein